MVGRTVSHYTIVEKLGAGGMGDIYKALDTRLNRTVAIKVLSASGAGQAGRRRFIQEAQAASALNHPNIITIHDIVSHEEAEFMVMEFVNGKTLAEMIPESGLGVQETLRTGVQIADALSAAHAAGIIHRDLKPGNVMVTGTGLVKVLDFGLAKFTPLGPPSQMDGTALTDETVADAPLTIEGSIIGTVSYMSPEQAQGKKVDARSDVFSFGILLYEMVTGHRAFASDSAVSTLSAILRDEVQPIAQVVRDVPPQLEEVITRALRKSPDGRWQSMKEMHEALAALKQKSDSGALEATRVIAPPAKKSRQRRLAGALIVVIAGAGVVWRTTHRAAPVVQAPPVIATPAPADSTLTNDSIIQMVEAKVPQSLIISQILSSKTNFDLSTSEIIRLTQAGVNEPILQAMRGHADAPVTMVKRGAPPPGAVTPPAPVVPLARPAATAHPVAVADSLPFRITLMEDVPADAQPGQPLRFEATTDFRIGDSIVVAKGAAVAGAVTEAGKKKFLGKGSKATFTLTLASAADGSKLHIRATPSHRDGKLDRPFELSNHTWSKETAAPAGTEYIAYTDGDQTVSLRK